MVLNLTNRLWGLGESGPARMAMLIKSQTSNNLMDSIKMKKMEIMVRRLERMSTRKANQS